MQHSISHRIFVPDSLKEKLLSHIANNPPEIKNFKIDKLLYIISLIHEIPARNKRKGLSDTGFANINSALLQEFIPDYKRYLDFLVAHNIIECDELYIPGYKSKGYRMASDYTTKVHPATIQNPELIRRIKYDGWGRGKHQKYKHLQKWLVGLEIDFNSALNHIRSQYDFRISHPDNREWDYKKKKYKDPLQQYNSALINIYYLKDKRHIFHVDQNVGRLHTNLTNIPSDLRNFITWKGQRLVTIDITNSQPYLSTILFKPSFYSMPVNGDKKLTVFSFFSHFSSFSPSHTSYPLGTAPPLMLGNPLRWIEIEDVKQYVKLVEKGWLYEHLEEAFKKELGLTFADRKDIKAAVFQVLFTDNRFIGQKEAAPKRLFKSLFPHVYELFSIYKKKDSTILPRLLQRIESHLILEIMCKRVNHEDKNIPLFTIHDSITTTIENLDYVKKIMSEELYKHIGVKPNLKMEYWLPDNLKVSIAS